MQDKLRNQLDVIKNIKSLYESREEVTKLYNDCSKISSKAVIKK